MLCYKPFDYDKLRIQLSYDEGVVYSIYLDSEDLPTFGIGHLILPSDSEFGLPVGTSIHKDRVLEAYEKDKAQSSPELKNLDEELTFAENDLLAKTISQESKKLNFKTSEQVEISVKGLENINIKSKEYQSAILEGINCKSGK